MNFSSEKNPRPDDLEICKNLVREKLNEKLRVNLQRGKKIGSTNLSMNFYVKKNEIHTTREEFTKKFTQKFTGRIDGFRSLGDPGQLCMAPGNPCNYPDFFPAGFVPGSS